MDRSTVRAEGKIACERLDGYADPLPYENMSLPNGSSVETRDLITGAQTEGLRNYNSRRPLAGHVSVIPEKMRKEGVLLEP